MSSLDPPAQRFTDELVVFRDYLVVVLLILPATVIVASPWILFFAGGWRLFLGWYLLPYPFALIGFATIMALINSRELKARFGIWRTSPKSNQLKNAA
jgi:uncharacterized RDD family membrane protein YckC